MFKKQLNGKRRSIFKFSLFMYFVFRKEFGDYFTICVAGYPTGNVFFHKKFQINFLSKNIYLNYFLSSLIILIQWVLYLIVKTSFFFRPSRGCFLWRRPVSLKRKGKIFLFIWNAYKCNFTIIFIHTKIGI